MFKQLRGQELDDAMVPIKSAELELAYKCLSIIENDMDVGFDAKEYQKKSGIKRINMSFSPDLTKRVQSQSNLGSNSDIQSNQENASKAKTTSQLTQHMVSKMHSLGSGSSL